MDWRRFHYICRRSLKELGETESISDCISRVEISLGCDCYGNAGHKNSIPQDLLKKLKNTTDRAEAKRTLGLYGQMDLSNLLTEPMYFKRVIIYLAIVVFVFALISGIYQFFVIPSFLETFESFDLAMPSQLLFYQTYWKYFVLIIFSLMASVLYISHFLKNLLAFKTSQLNTHAILFFLFKKIRNSYASILETIYYPITKNTSHTNNHKGNIVDHLKDAEKIKMDLATEIYAIIAAERKKLLAISEKLMRILSMIIAIIVISVIFDFLASAYSPMFALGEIM